MVYMLKIIEEAIRKADMIILQSGFSHCVSDISHFLIAENPIDSDKHLTNIERLFRAE